MKRKVIQIANSTQLISLPRKWAIERGIKKGDELDVEIDGDRLLIGGKRERTLESAKISFKRGEPYIRRTLSTLYKLGYDEVEIQYEDPQLIEQVKQHTETLLGYEIIHEGSKRCVVKNVAATLESEFDNMLRRVFLTTVTLGKETLAAAEAGDYDQLENIMELERASNKFTFFCERVLNKFGYRDAKKQCLLHTLLSIMEQVADAYGFICYHLRQERKTPMPETLAVFKDVVALTDDVYQLFYQYSVSKLSEFKELKKKTEKHCYALLTSAKRTDPLIVHQLLVIIYLLHHGTECIT